MLWLLNSTSPPRRSQLRRLGRAALLTLISACQPAPPASLASDVRPLERCALPADSIRHVILLDHSGSMRPSWPTVRNQLAAIVAAVPDGNWLHVEGFAGRVVTLIHDVQMSPTNRATVMQQALRLPEPQRMAPTDLGRAMEAALDDITRARERGRGRVSFLFFVTDGRHDPAPDSPYLDAAPFARLRAQWLSRLRDPDVHAFVFAIPVGAGLEGADLVQQTIPTTLGLPRRDPGELAEAVNDIVLRAGKDVKRALVGADSRYRSERLHAYVPEEAAVGWWRAREVPVVVRSAAACVTYDLSDVQLTDGGGIRGLSGKVESGAVRIAPGDSAVVVARLKAARPAGHWWPGAAPIVDTLNVAGGVGLAAHARLEPAAAIEALILDPGADTVRVAIDGMLERGPMSWLAFSGLATTVLGGLLLLGYSRLPARPGAFRPTAALDPEGRAVAAADLRRDARGRRVLCTLPNGTTVWVEYWRASRLVSPRRVRVRVEADRAGVVAIAEPAGRGGGHRVTMLSGRSPGRELGRKAYVVWAANGEPLPSELAPGQVNLLPGYYWSGRS